MNAARREANTWFMGLPPREQFNVLLRHSGSAPEPTFGAAILWWTRVDDAEALSIYNQETGKRD